MSDAASTVAISDSSLALSVALFIYCPTICSTYVGFMLVIVWPPVALTNSPLMYRPVGSVIFLPLGAVKFTERFDMVARRPTCKRNL